MPDTKGPRLSINIALDLTHEVAYECHAAATIDGPAFDDFCTDLYASYIIHGIDQACLITGNAPIHKLFCLSMFSTATSWTVVFLHADSPMLMPIEEAIGLVKTTLVANSPRYSTLI
jgi:hypothetical protein